MRQQILITDLTQMQGDRVCIAGISREWQGVRPDLPYPGIYKHHLYRDGKLIIRPRAVIELDLEPKNNCKAPHTEDHHWHEPQNIEFVRLLSEKEWLKNLRRMAEASPENCIKAELHQNKRVKPDEGVVSLATIQCADLLYFIYGKDPRRHDEYHYRLAFRDQAGNVYDDISITDLTLRRYVNHLRVQQGMSTGQISDLLHVRLTNVDAIWLRLGLTRPFRATEDARSELWCYLQVNGIYTSPDYLDGKCFADFE